MDIQINNKIFYNKYEKKCEKIIKTHKKKNLIFQGM